MITQRNRELGLNLNKGKNDDKRRLGRDTLTKKPESLAQLRWQASRTALVANAGTTAHVPSDTRRTRLCARVAHTRKDFAAVVRGCWVVFLSEHCPCQERVLCWLLNTR